MKRGAVRVAAIFTTVSLLLVPLLSRAEPPTLDYIFPAGGQQGTTNIVSVGGKFEPWPPKIWIDCLGVQFEAQTNKGAFKLSIATNAPVGPHLLRIFNSEGASVPKCFVIGGEKEVAEVEPNDSWKQAQQITNLPVVVNGRLEKSGDVDSFAIRLDAGKWLTAAIDGYALGSPIDPNLTLLDDHGRRVALNSDSRQSCDPLLEYNVEKSGTYIVQVTAFAFPPAAEIRLAGSAAAVYRLTITQGPFVSAMFPASLALDCKTEIGLIGHNLAKQVWNPGLTRPDGSSVLLDRAKAGTPNLTVPNSLGKLRVAISDLAQELERAPNNSASQAQPLRWPVTISGKIDQPGDEDQFGFEAKKGQKIEFRLRSAQLGLPLDATLRIEDRNGKQIVRDDDSGEASDPLLNWSAPSNGTYRVIVADLYHRGGPEFAYALEVREPVPDFKVTVDSSAFRVEPGKTNEVKLAITRLAGQSEKLQAIVRDLPKGVSAKTSTISGKDKQAKVLLIAATNAPPYNGPFQIEVQEVGGTNSTARLLRRARFDLGPKESRFGEMLIPHTDQLWLTVATNAAPAEKPKTK